MRTVELSAFSTRFRLQPRAALFWCALLGCVVVDRWLWSAVAQWGEDEGTNLWLGYLSRLDWGLPAVGLLSSKQVPNPNGMPLLCVPLSLLPSLLWVSLICSLAQAAAIVWASYELSRGARWVRLCLALPPLASVVLRAASVELWNQWLFITINALFVALLARELRKHHPLHYVALAWLILLSPTLYLAGLLNGLLFAAALLVLLVQRAERIQWRSRSTLACLGVIAVSVVASIWITWLPFLRTLPLSKLTALQSAPPHTRVKTAWQAIKQTRRWLFEVHPSDLSAIFQSDEGINGPHVQRYAELAANVFTLQLWIALFASSIALVYVLRQRRWPLRLTPLWLFAGVLAAYAGSPLLGGFEWHRGERSDQSLTFLIWLFWTAYSVPLLGRALGKLRGFVTVASVCTALIYTGLAGYCGAAAVQAHLKYRGRILSEADVPVTHKEAALAFIARDWLARAPHDPVPLHYEIAGNRGWVREHSELMMEYLPEPMFTVGRALDWELARRFGLRNVHEGTNRRRFKGDRYVMTYARNRVPGYLPPHAEHHVFGRIRVSVVQPH